MLHSRKRDSVVAEHPPNDTSCYRVYGFSRDGLPLALQIVGRPADEEGLLAIGAAFEEARPWHGQHPPLA